MKKAYKQTKINNVLGHFYWSRAGNEFTIFTRFREFMEEISK